MCIEIDGFLRRDVLTSNTTQHTSTNHHQASGGSTQVAAKLGVHTRGGRY
jgi:hypothetical protein